MTVFALEGVIRDYAWGSTTAIQHLLGLPVDGRPAAELWLGAHPDDPSVVPDHETTLDELLASAPRTLLGDAVVERFGPQLPFLLKVLAAGKALSIQVHPTIEQARAGFERENDAGLARDAPERNYRDANHKPELLCALTEFDALCGFRPVDGTLRLFDALAVPQLAPVADLLRGAHGLRAAFTALLQHDQPGPLVDAITSAATSLTGEWSGVRRVVELTSADAPGDIGIAVALLLNDVRLQPGEAIFLGAGNVHAYLRGTGVEIMANSDNVLRCGLTPKHVDVPELLAITDFTPLLEPRCPTRDVPAGHGAYGFEIPVDDFALMPIDLDAFGGYVTVGDTGPHIVLCTGGAATVSAAGEQVELTPGRAAFVASRAEPFTVEGAGQIFAATVGLEI